MNQLPAILKKERESRNLRRAPFARLIGVSSQLYGQYEDGKKTPGVDFYKKWKAKIGSDLFETVVSNETPKQAMQEPKVDYEAKLSLERSLENLTVDKLRSTAIIERLVTLLEIQMKSEEAGPHNQKPGKVGEELQHKKTSSKAG